MDLPELLALLHRGGRDLRTVRLTAVTRTDREAVARAMKRRCGTHIELVAVGGGEEPSRFSEEVTRLWLERPDKVREEVEGGHPHVGVRVGDTWWLYAETMGAMTNEGSPDHGSGIGQALDELVRPARLLPMFDFEVLGDEEHAGRPAVRVHGRRRADYEDFRHSGSDACDLLVDREHGILLRMATFVDEDVAVDTTVVEVAYGETFPPETFVLEPPPGVEMENVEERHRFREEPLEVVAAKAGFTVFIADGLDDPWTVRAMHMPNDEVSLQYHRRDATGFFTIGQSSEGGVWSQMADEELEHEGIAMRVKRRTETSPPAIVAFERGGTAIEIVSDNLGLDRLLEIAVALLPVPG